jgi:hypothetical protein
MQTVAEHLNLHLEEEVLPLEEEVLPPCLPDMSNAPCRLTESQSQSLNESIASQQTLKDKTKTQATTTAQAELLAQFMRLPIEHQKRALGLDDTDKDNDDWGNSYASRNRASHKAGGGTSGAGDLEMKKLKTSVKESLGKEFSGEFAEQAESLFWNAVKNKAKTVAAANKLAEMIDESFADKPYLRLAFADDKTIDAVELLSNKIEELEEDLAILEEEHARLIDEELARYHSLEEETLFNTVTRPPRRSTRNVAEDLEGVDPENRYLMEDGTRQHLDPQMARYVQKLNETTRNVDVHTPNENLLEAWKNN